MKIMRQLVRWSDSSLSMTTPTPCRAEPSRRMPGSLLHRLCRLVFEVAGIDRLEARLLHAEIFQPALHGYHLSRSLRPHVTIGMQAQFSDACLLDAADARNKGEPLGKSRAVRLDVDHVAGAQHLATELRHRAHERDAPRAKQRHAIADALHPLEQVRRQQNRNALGLKAADDAKKL